MLPKKFRLTKDKDFEKVAKQGRACFTKGLGIKYIRNNLAISRFGIVVSLKVSKKATQRNKIKRRLREIIRKKLPEVKSGYDIMVLTNPSSLEFDYHQMGEKITGLFKKAGLL